MKAKQSSDFSSFFINLVLVGVLTLAVLGAAVAPSEAPLTLYETEVRQSVRLFGDWPTKTALTLQEEVEQAKEEFQASLPQEEGFGSLVSEWLYGRAEFVSNAVLVWLQRSCVLVLCLALFLPAGGIAFYCGHLRREAAKQQFSFTSPYRMRTRWMIFRLLVLAMVALLFFPTSVFMPLFPTLIGGLALYSGALVSGLQKEI